MHLQTNPGFFTHLYICQTDLQKTDQIHGVSVPEVSHLTGSLLSSLPFHLVATVTKDCAYLTRLSLNFLNTCMYFLLDL